MTQKYLDTLELYKVIDKAVEYAACSETKESLQQEAPFTHTNDVRLALRQTKDVAILMITNGNPRITACDGAKEAVSLASKGGILSMGELLQVNKALRNINQLVGWFSVETDREATTVDDLFYSLTAEKALEKSIATNILSPEEMADTASNELYSIRRRIRATESSIRDRLDSLIKSPSKQTYLQEPIVSIRDGRFVVPVKAEYRNQISGVIHDVSSSGGTLFIEPTTVVDANARIMQLRNQETGEIDRILSNYTNQLAEHKPFFDASYQAMLAIDKRVAKAELAYQMNAALPTISDEPMLSLIEARHPLLEQKTVVPIDVELGKSYDTLIITGPNTGGKTVTLKTVGLLCAMAQMGYLIPAHENSVVGVFGSFLVDIGDEQSIEQSLSTFSGHIQNITGILKQVNSKSLVLLDELGAGTDPAEGAALAIAIIEELRAGGARVMATTHYAELKMYALETEGIQNAGSEFDLKTLRPTYRLNIGTPGRSNAFLIGEKYGISHDIIQNAKRHMSGEQRRFEAVVAELDDMKLVLEEQKKQIESLKESADEQLKQARKQKEQLVRQGEKELEEARLKAKELSDQVQTEAYDLLDELKSIEKEKRDGNAKRTRRARQIARREASDLYDDEDFGKQPQERDYKKLTTVKEGQQVFLPDMNKVAMVTSAPDRSDQVELRIGAIRTTLPLDRLAALPKEKKQQQKEKAASQQPSQSKRKFTARTSSSELNLLGKTVEEAILEADRFLDDAVLSGHETVYIIHGKGTGTLRSAIDQHLRSHRSVKSYRLGEYGEGGDGVTVVQL